MQWKGLAILALLLAIVQGSTVAGGQAAGGPGGASQTAHAPASAQGPAGVQPHATHPATAANPAQDTGVPPGASDTENGAVDYQPSHITIATPAPPPAAWPWQERIAWGANLVLVVLGYVGILFALSLLRKIERQTEYAEKAALAASASAESALLQAQAMVRAERPWIVVTVEPSRRAENRFMLMATNRGRGPARVLLAEDKITTEIDQSALPEAPSYEDAKPNASLASVILLPGESTGIKSFSREDAKEYCGSEEKLKRVEKWEEVILLYGRILYQDLLEAGAAEPFQTGWCSWYIHGRQNSGMVMAGPPAYNRHT